MTLNALLSLKEPLLPKRLGVVITGGTIGSLTSGGDVDLAHAASGPELDVLNAAYLGHASVSHPLRVLSENIVPTDWVVIAKAVREQVSLGADGVLVLHGTDTLTYTASALAFLLNDLKVPVVLSGANLPPSEPDSDAVHNVRDATIALGALGPGVYVSFAGAPQATSFVHAATRVRKLRASGQTFYSVNSEPVASITDRIFSPGQMISPPAGVSSLTKVDPNVLSFKLYPGMNFDLLRRAVLPGGVRGVVIELYASATGPDLKDAFSLPRFIKLAVRSGVVVATTLFTSPRRELFNYPSTHAIREAGGLFLDGCLPETALTKLMWALGQTREAKVVRALMEQSLANELTAGQI